MYRVKMAGLVAFIALGLIAGCAVPTSERSVTAYEGARLIIGDGRLIENATLVVDGTKIAHGRYPGEPRRQDRDADDR